MDNKEAFKNEYIFIMFDDIIKSYAPMILKTIKSKKYVDNYKDFINYKLFNDLTDKQLNYFTLKRTHRNVLDYVKLNKFDTGFTLMDIMVSNPQIYTESVNLHMVNVLKILGKQSFTKSIYVYSEEDNDYIKTCVSLLFGHIPNCFYITGDFKSVIKSIKEPISLYVLNDANYLYDIIDCDKVHYTDILIADYGYNYTYDNEQKKCILKITDSFKLSNAECFRLKMFIPYAKEQLIVI